MALRGLWREFKAFAFKGSMIDLAVAVVIGAAFSGVINSLVKDIIMPSLTYVTTGARSAIHGASNVASTVGGSKDAAATQGSATEPATQESHQTVAPPPPPAQTPASNANDEKAVDFSWTIGRIRIGNFIGELINFVLIAFAVFITIVKLLGSVVKRVSSTPDPSEPATKECPFCLSVIPARATKCAHCTADQPSSAAAR